MSNVRMTKTIKILDRSGTDTDPLGIFYSQRDEDQPWGPMKSHLRISHRDFIDMGAPDQITVTIEPGDRLNEEDQS